MEIIVPAIPQEPRYPICNCDAEDCRGNTTSCIGYDCYVFHCSVFCSNFA